MFKRSKMYLQVTFVFFTVALVLTGCGNKEVKLTRTGFLNNYSGLREDENSKGMRIYKNPYVDIGQRYSKVMISPVQIRLDPTLEGDALTEEDRKKLGDYFYDQLRERLTEMYKISDAPGSDVLILRAAITDVLPNKVYLNLHWTTTLYGAGIGGASLEAELVDSLSGERMMAFVDARKGKKINYFRGVTKWGHTKEVLKKWAKIMVMNLKEMKNDNLARF